MNKAWITGVTVVSVAATGGAAYATMQGTTQHNSAAAEGAPTTVEATTTTEGTQAYEFQAGPAGTVHLLAAQGALRVVSALPSIGWTLMDYTSPAAHVEVRLSDGTQIVIFAGDLVNGKVVAALSAAPVPTVASTTPATPAPQPATPPQQLAPAVTAPPATHTSAPSGSQTTSGGSDDGPEHESDDSHESEHESGGGDD